MSSSLIRRGLDLYKNDLSQQQHHHQQQQRTKGKPPSSSSSSSNKNGNNTKKDKSLKNLTEKELTHLVGTNKKGFRRKLKRLHEKKNDATLKGKKVKSHESLYESHRHHDMTDANLNALNFMKLLNKDEKKVMENAAHRHETKNMGRKHKKSQKEATTKTTDNNSVFTESDFEKFFKEYNFS